MLLFGVLGLTGDPRACRGRFCGPCSSGASASRRYGLASLRRHQAASVVQIVALSLGFMALLLLTVTRNELLDAWQRAIPPEAPNRFVVNIQPDQRDAVRQFFAQDDLALEFALMVRGRTLSRSMARKAVRIAIVDDRAKRLVEREFNLSYRSDLPEGNMVTAGRWFNARRAWSERRGRVLGR